MASAVRSRPGGLVRYAALAQTLGLILMLFGASVLFPLAISHFLDDGAQVAYDEALVLTFGCGAGLWVIARGHEGELEIRDGFLLVALTWTLLPAFATLPLMIYLPELSFTDAYFETVSGLTTTGATVLDGLDKLPPSINVWRSQLVWMGGLGVVVLAVAGLDQQRIVERTQRLASGDWSGFTPATTSCISGKSIASARRFEPRTFNRGARGDRREISVNSAVSAVVS